MGCGTSKTEGDLKNNNNIEKAQTERGSDEYTDNENLEKETFPELLQEPDIEDVDVPRELPGYPPPKPCTDRKVDIFNPNTFRNLDNRVRQTPAEMANTYPDLMSYLCAGCTSDVETLRAIFIWVGCQSIETSDYSDVTDSECPSGFMKLIKEKRASYASFFAVLCRHAHIPCVILSGYAKSVGYQVGDTEEKVRRLGNTWNAVYVADGWRLVFPLWACRVIVGHSTGAFTKVEAEGKAVREKETKLDGVTTTRLNEYYFLTDPENFIYVAYPTDRRWQLLARPWSMKQFVDIPHCRHKYFTEGVRIISESKSRIRTIDGMCEVELTAEEPRGFHLNYELFYNHEESGKEISDDLQLNNYVLLNRSLTAWKFQVRFPEPGVYKLEITGGRRYSTDMCYFKIYCDEEQYECKALPVNPGRIGYGPSLETELAGIKATSHRNGLVKVALHRQVDFIFTLSRRVSVRTELVNGNIDNEELQKCLQQRQKTRNLNLSVTVPEEGEYALRLYAREGGEESDKGKNVCNYLLSSEVGGKRRRKRTWENTAEQKARSTMQARRKFEHLKLDDKGDLATAVAALEFKPVQRELQDAINRRHIQTLDTAIAHGHESRFKEKLATLIGQAQQLRNHLRDFDRFAHDVLAMTQPTISELRSYKYPPEVVDDVMTATFRMLGEKRKFIEDWTDAQTLMGRQGKQRMLRRVRRFDTINVEHAAVAFAREVLREHTEMDARQASAGCGTFYIWLRNVTSSHTSEEVARKSE